MRIITNSNKPNDRMFKLISEQGKNTQVLIASAFFNESKMALEMVNNNCTIMLIVRLDYGTDPEALREILGNKNIDIRFFTGKYFHPKFYIFGNNTAYLGSSNFTHSGMQTNNEVNIEFDSEEPVFEELKSVFWDYWNQAEVLTKEKLDKFADVVANCKNPEPFRSIMAKVGTYEYNNVGRTEISGKQKEKYVSNFRKSYQRYISCFNILKDIYESSKVRRYPNVPLRIEVDRFLWWIREVYAAGENYRGVPEKDIASIKKEIIPYIKEFENVKNDYLDTSASTRFFSVSNGFKSKEMIEKMSFDEIFDILAEVYAFHDSLRFYSGGLATLKETFKNENELDKIKKTIIYLLFGKNEYEERIFDCCYDERYKLKCFGDHCLKELYGLVNSNDIPICNGRTLKSMEWLGFGKL